MKWYLLCSLFALTTLPYINIYSSEFDYENMDTGNKGDDLKATHLTLTDVNLPILHPLNDENDGPWEITFKNNKKIKISNIRDTGHFKKIAPILFAFLKAESNHLPFITENNLTDCYLTFNNNQLKELLNLETSNYFPHSKQNSTQAQIELFLMAVNVSTSQKYGDLLRICTTEEAAKESDDLCAARKKIKTLEKKQSSPFWKYGCIGSLFLWTGLFVYLARK